VLPLTAAPSAVAWPYNSPMHFFISRLIIPVVVTLIATMLGFGKLAFKDFRASREKKRLSDK
jgi:hypothetical protein